MAGASSPSCAASPAEPTIRERPSVLDCAWVASPTNCYRTFVASVDACLGATRDVGTLDVDVRVCRYPLNARTVTFHTALGAAVRDGKPGKADLHFSVVAGGRRCLEQLEVKGERGFRSIGPEGRFALTVTGAIARVTCADGSEIAGNLDDLFGRAGACPGAQSSGGFPDTSWSEQAPFFRFAGAAGRAYECYRLHESG